jgi:hypothetical protein
MSPKMISSLRRPAAKPSAIIPYLVADNDYMNQADHGVYNLSQITSSNRPMSLAYYCFRAIFL